MKVIRLHAPLSLKLHNEQISTPAAGEVLIKIKSVGVCASDVHWYREGKIGSTKLDKPLVLGHEASGEICAIGDNVSSLKVGDRVAIEPANPCMKCKYCVEGNYNVCIELPFFGTPPTDGCFREYITWPASLCLKIPDNVSFDEAAMAEPMAVGFFAVELSKIKSIQSAAVMGLGAIGLSVIQALKVLGIKKIVAIDSVNHRCKLALKLGASNIICKTGADAKNALWQIIKDGPDVVFECTGAEDANIESSKLAKVMGRIVVVGIPEGDHYIFDSSDSRRKQLSIIFVRRSNLTTEKVLTLVSEGKINLKSYATHHFTLEQIQQAMEIMAERNDGVIRSMVVIQ